MARTVADVVLEARQILQDTELDYRYPDEDLYGALTSAVSEAKRARPDLFAGRLFAPLRSYTPADGALAFPLDEQWFIPVANFIVGRAEMRDDETGTQRAGSFLTAFQTALRTATA